VKRVFIVITLLALLGVVAMVAINFRVTSYSGDRTYNSVESVPSEDRVAIVLGARVGDDGVASNTLNDRTVVSAELYLAGKVSKLLMSGGNSEPEVMKKLAMRLGVAEGDIILDDQGLRTYESCVRAKQVFGVNKAMIVTQDYHIPRSIYLCQSLGIDSVAIDAKRRDYDGERYLWIREYFSRVLAWFEINTE
jgi:vancomycin permeability regulator SanA